MSFAGRMVAALGIDEALHSSNFLVDFHGARRSAAGALISSNSALHHGPYYAAIRAISEDIGKMPFIVFRQLSPRGRERLPEHPVSRLLNIAPNPNMTPIAFRENLTHHALGWGSGFAEIERNGGGKPVNLWPIHPSRTQIVQRPISEGGEIVYRVRADSLGGQVVEFEQDDILHIHGLGADGIMGYTLSVLAREAIGLGLEAERFGATFFGNDATPGFAMIHPETLSVEAKKTMRDSWNEIYAGADNGSKFAILEENIKLESFAIPPEQAQFLQTRKFQVTEIARWFRISPHKIQDLERSTFSNIEMQNIEHVTDTLDPWATRWEQEIKRKLLDEPDIFADIDFARLLRGDAKTRAEVAFKLVQIGALSPNEVREIENRNPVAGLDMHFMLANMVPIGEGPAVGRPSSSAGRPNAVHQVKPVSLREQWNLARAAKDPEALARVLAGATTNGNGNRNGAGEGEENGEE